MEERTVITVTKWDVEGVMNHHTVKIITLNIMDQVVSTSEYRRRASGQWGKIEYGRGLQPLPDPSIIPWLNALVLGYDALQGA